jgi:deoxyxylulose-5-phosphate synthase
MLVTSIQHDGPCALRIPRGEGEGVPLAEEGFEPLQIGRGELLTDGDDLLIVAYGSMVYPGPGHGWVAAGAGGARGGDQRPLPAAPR